MYMNKTISLHFQWEIKNLDPADKMDPDFWDCFGWEKQPIL